MKDFKFIDLFAGIGGIRIAMEAAGGTCILTAENDRFARITYEAFFQENEHHVFVEDIKTLQPSDFPNHDILCAGFPCQPFSLAGVSKRLSLGQPHGFGDATKGSLFFCVKDILVEKKPKALLLENVKHLLSHDTGRTWKAVSDALRYAGYVFSAKVIDSSKVVPQHRQRLYVVGLLAEDYDLSVHGCFDWSPFWNGVDNLLREAHCKHALFYGTTLDSWPRVGPILEQNPDPKYTLTERLWNYLQSHKEKHRLAGNGFGYGTVGVESKHTRTLSARYFKDGAEILVEQSSGPPRRLTPRECARIQGFPIEFQEMFGTNCQPVSDTQAYKQLGNSVTVPVVSAVSLQLRRLLECELSLKSMSGDS